VGPCTALAAKTARRFCSWKFLPREKGAARHARTRLSFTAAHCPRVLRQPGWRSCFELPLTCASCRLQSVASSAALLLCCCRACSLLSHYQPMTLQPALSPGLGPGQADHSPLPRHLPPSRPKVDDEKSAAMLLRRFAGGEELRNLLLPLECTADPLRQVRQSTRLQLCPRMHPGQTAKLWSDREKEGWQECFHKKTRQRSSGAPAIQDLAFAKAPWFAGCGPLAISAPSQGSYDSRPSLTGGDVSSFSSRTPVNTTLHLDETGDAEYCTLSCFHSMACVAFEH
jgi:hypothetical protein